MGTNSSSIMRGMICVVINNVSKLLLLKRSPSKKLFPNKWFVVGAAPLLESDDMRAIALREIKDELGVEGKILVEGREIRSKMEGKDWVVTLFLASIDVNEVVLNEEHTEYKWIDLEEVGNYDTVPGTLDMVKMVLGIHRTSRS